MEKVKRLKYPIDWMRARESNRRISMVTAYDAAFAKLASRSGVDAILVGDSLGMVVQGERTTLPVTVQEIIYHSKMVRRGAPDMFVVSDMPFGSYQHSPVYGAEQAIRIMKESGCDAVKLEGAHIDTLHLIEKLAASGVPVMGHIGLTPQSVHTIGGYRVQGRTDEIRKRLKEEGVALQNAGAFAVVLELVAQHVAQEITESLQIPTIGIGSGPKTSGQVLVIHDLLGLEMDFKPKHTKRYANIGETVIQSLARYREEVVENSFPSQENSFD